MKYGLWPYSVRVHVKKFEGHQTGLETKEVSSDLLAPLLLLSRYSGVGDFTKWLDQPWDEDPLFFLRSYTMCSHISFLVLYCSRKEEAGGFRPRPRPQSLSIAQYTKTLLLHLQPLGMYVDVAFKGALQHARNWFPMHSRSSYVKKSNNAEAVEAASCCLRWRPSQCQRHLEHEERSLLPFFCPFSKLRCFRSSTQSTNS